MTEDFTRENTTIRVQLEDALGSTQKLSTENIKYKEAMEKLKEATNKEKKEMKAESTKLSDKLKEVKNLMKVQ